MENVDSKKIKEIYKYLSEETSPLSPAEGAFVFCRDDPLIAKKVAKLFNEKLINYAMFTGGIGKDSGFLKDLEMPEAKWQSALLNIIHGISKENIYIESKSSNGGEACRFGVDTIVRNSLPHHNLIVVCHSSSLRRLEASLQIESEKKNFDTQYQKTGTNYEFNPRNPKDQKEVVAELLRLADWPAKGWAKEQEDLPLGLVEYAREIKTVFQ